MLKEWESVTCCLARAMGRERNLIKNSPVPGHWQPGDTDFMKRNIEGVRKVTPRECARLQGFPDSFKIPVADTQAYRQFANSVAVPVIASVAKQMLKTLEALSSGIQLSRELMLAETKSA